MWRVFLALLLFLPYVALAEPSLPDLVVQHDLTLSGQIRGYRMITVEVGVTLTVTAGTEITFQFGGGIEGEGSLKVTGTEAAEVNFSGTAWEGVSLSGAVDIHWLHISGAAGPFVFRGVSTKFDHVMLHDVPDSRLFIQPTDGGSVSLHYLTVRWGIVTSTTGQVDIRIIGRAGDLDFLNLLLPRKVLLGSTEVVHIVGGYRSLNMIGAKTADGCFLFPKDLNPWESATYQADLNCQPPEPSLLFIPGFGASLNFNYLLDPQPTEPAGDGWSFIPFLTNSYKYFLNQVANRGIKSSTAYYDWRRPLPDIVRDYLIPAIDLLKQRDSVSQVFLVAHSMGGLVARQYIESASYRGDVAGLVELATPNQGSVKAYSSWEGGVFPSDWQIIGNLARYYHYRASNLVDSDLAALRSFIPSGESLLPTDPVLSQTGLPPWNPLSLLTNTDLLDLNSKTSLLNQLSTLFTVAGTGPSTVDHLVVGEPRPRAFYWPDGELTPGGERSFSTGDGVVSLASASLPSTSQAIFAADHVQLPESAASYILERLYPHRAFVPPPPLSGASRLTSHILWFAFDCPVTVTITSPTGQVVTSNPELSDTTAVYNSPEVIWMLLPEEVGTYHLEITALADTEVRWWQGVDSIHVYHLTEGEVRKATYTVAPLPSTPAPSPTSAALTSAPPDLPDPPQNNARSIHLVFTPFNLLKRPWHLPAPLLWMAAVTPSTKNDPPQKQTGPLRISYLLLAAPMLLRPRRKPEQLLPPRHPP